MADSLAKRGALPSIAELRRANVSDQALKRAIVVEFGDELAVFEALSPQEYILNGEVVPMRKVPTELM